MSELCYNMQPKIWIIKHKYLLKYPVSIQCQWKRDFNLPVLTITIDNLFNKWETTGSVIDAPRPGQPLSIRTEENCQLLKHHNEDHPQTSTRQGSSQLDINSSSLRRIIKDLKLHHFKPKLVQSLNEDIYDRRVQFCDEMLVFFHIDPQLIEHIIWSDGIINRHNSVYYAEENPPHTVTKGVASSGLFVWAAIHGSGVIGPYFFDGTCNADYYIEMLSTFFLPALQALPDSDSYILQ